MNSYLTEEDQFNSSKHSEEVSFYSEASGQDMKHPTKQKSRSSSSLGEDDPLESESMQPSSARSDNRSVAPSVYKSLHKKSNVLSVKAFQLLTNERNLTRDLTQK